MKRIEQVTPFVNRAGQKRGLGNPSHFFVCALFLMAHHWAMAQTLSDFGYQHMSSKYGPPARQVPLGNRYCLVVLMDDANTGVFATNATFYQSIVFDMNATNSVNGYINEISCGRFQLRPANLGGGTGVMGPLTLTAAELTQLATNPGTVTDGQVALSAAVRNGFPIASYDFNGDGKVSFDELVLLVVANKTPRGPGQTVRFSINLAGKNCDMQVSSVPENTVFGRFPTVIHELHHNFGNMWDLYYYTTYIGTNYTLNFARTLAADQAWVHLDPWEKMCMGWNEPRIVSMAQGGSFFIPAAQNADPTAPIILYDPSRGTGEFFILEYRTANRTAGGGYDFQVAAQGLFLWHVQLDGSHDLITATSPFGFTGPNTKPYTDWIEGPPNNTTPDAAWPANQTTPYLTWNDGTQAIARLRTSNFQVTDSGIVVEVLVDRPDVVTWVDFFAPLLPQLGTFDFPYKTLPPAINAVGYAGNLSIKTSTGSPAPITISKPMTITSYGGPATID
jgi:M6 family metalloprotease-like protein